MTKTLETDSVLNNADANGDNVISNDELVRHERMLKIENEDKKEDHYFCQIRFHGMVCIGRHAAISVCSSDCRFC